ETRVANASLTKTLEVSKEKLFQAITRYEDYPQFVTGGKKVEVERKAAGHEKVKYVANLLGKDLWYVLEHTEDLDAGRVTWKLLDSDTMKLDTGTWTLRDLGGGKTEVSYTIEIEFKVWVPGPILKGLTTAALPA